MSSKKTRQQINKDYNNKNSFYCGTCDKTMNITNMNKHLKTEKHKLRCHVRQLLEMNKNQEVQQGTILCNYCDKEYKMINYEFGYNQHLCYEHYDNFIKPMSIKLDKIKREEPGDRANIEQYERQSLKDLVEIFMETKKYIKLGKFKCDECKKIKKNKYLCDSFETYTKVFLCICKKCYKLNEDEYF